MIDISFTDKEMSEEEAHAKWLEWNQQMGEKLRAEQAERDRQDAHDLALWNERQKRRNMDGAQPHPLL